MNKDIKKVAGVIFVIPAPERKDEFIREYRRKEEKIEGRKKQNILYMLMIQAKYMGSYIWISSILVFLLGVVSLRIPDENSINGISMIMPFLSGIAVYATFRSEINGMYEMEWASRFSLREILFARITVIGIVHLLVTLCLTIMLSNDRYEILYTGIQIIIPYLLTSILCMEIERTTLGRKNVVTSICVSAAVSLCLFCIKHWNLTVLTDMKDKGIVTAIILVIIESYELRKIYKLEAYTWN